MFTSDLLDAHRGALKKEGTIAELFRRVEELGAAGEAASSKVARPQVLAQRPLALVLLITKHM